MVVTASKLRDNIYRLLDQVLETGVPIEIERKGQRLRIVAVAGPSRFARLVERPGALRCDPDELVSIDWSSGWGADEDLHDLP
jgi:hypothetical protein